MQMNFLFYECLPSKSLHLKSEKCVGGKHSKVRLTGMAAANTVGDKLPMSVVQKYIRALDRKEPLTKINIISAMNMLVTAWSMVTKTTVINYFTKAGMSEALQE